MSDERIEWDGITLWGDYRTDLGFTELAGWEELPEARSTVTVRPQAHGVFDSPVWASARRVSTLGYCSDPARRDSIVRALQRSAGWSASGGIPAPLTITMAGETLTAMARVSRCRSVTDHIFSVGYSMFAVEWVCPDPYRYGPWRSVTSGDAAEAVMSGLQFPLMTNGQGIGVGWLDFGGITTGSRIVLDNPGTADAWPQWILTGPIGPVTLVSVETARRITYADYVPAGSVVIIDSANGRALLNGQADRSGKLTAFQSWPIPAEGTSTVSVEAMSGDGEVSGAWRPTWW